MSKWVKRLLGIAAVATTAAGLFYFFKKEDTASCEDFEDDFEDEDFDLDTDLKPTSERGYVSLTPQSKSEEAENTNEANETTAEEAAETTEALNKEPSKEEKEAAVPEETDAKED